MFAKEEKLVDTFKVQSGRRESEGQAITEGPGGCQDGDPFQCLMQLD